MLATNCLILNATNHVEFESFLPYRHKEGPCLHLIFLVDFKIVQSTKGFEEASCRAMSNLDYPNVSRGMEVFEITTMKFTLYILPFFFRISSPFPLPARRSLNLCHAR